MARLWVDRSMKLGGRCSDIPSTVESILFECSRRSDNSLLCYDQSRGGCRKIDGMVRMVVERSYCLTLISL